MRLNIFRFIVLLVLFQGIATGETTLDKPFDEIQISKQDWEYTSFSEEGIDPTRFELLKKVMHDGIFKKVDSIVVVKAGKILIEEYYNGFDRNNNIWCGFITLRRHHRRF